MKKVCNRSKYWMYYWQEHKVFSIFLGRHLKWDGKGKNGGVKSHTYNNGRNEANF